MAKPPVFDRAFAEQLVGKRVLIALRTLDMRGELKSEQQIYGQVISADQRTGFRLRLEGLRAGEEVGLPPDTRTFATAENRFYTLEDTGEQVESPDFVAGFTITLRQIVDGRSPILHVTHDADDHGWQFLTLDDAREEDAVVVGFSEVVDGDPSLLELADLPPGWHAWRTAHNQPWQRGPNPADRVEDGSLET